MRKKNHPLNGIRCSCGAIGRMVFNGPRVRKDRESVQKIRCGVCGKTGTAVTDTHPLSRQLKNREVLLNILKDLAKGMGIRKTATANSSSPGTVMKTRDKMQEFIKKKFEEVSKETELSAKEIFAIMQRKWDRDKKKQQD